MRWQIILEIIRYLLGSVIPTVKQIRNTKDSNESKDSKESDAAGK